MIDVALKSNDLRPAGVTVVIDVLRATSTIAQALDGGYARVLCTATLDDGLALRAPGRVLAGEQRCLPPDGFDLGNSPAGVATATGTELVICTTNGAPAIVAAAGAADEVLLGSLLNLDALVECLRAEDRTDDLLLVCSGTNGRLAIEDIYVAGRIVAALGGPATDAARTAELVAAATRSTTELFENSMNGRVLVDVGLAQDIAWCVRESVLQVVPRVVESTTSVATITA
ncbi:MAG TPA: 2-phosphosulfolactate phosphatase [Solirubrobacteraceae bacterium]|jgi:2-phosphosulfolactate phosphatase|nr:2-phosphosulfolactate phosphatase [Solirubrobacteraceae bacterium]